MWRLLLILLLSGCIQTGQLTGKEEAITPTPVQNSDVTTPTPTETPSSEEKITMSQQTPTPVTTPTKTSTPTPTPATTPIPTPTLTPTTTPCIAGWQCADWSACENSKQSRNCTDVNVCTGAKAEQQDCVSLNHVVFSEVFYDTPGNDNVEEWFKLYNPFVSVQELANWSVSDNAGEWRFSASIPAKAYLTIARNSGGFKNLTGCDAGISGFTRGLNNDGDYLFLRDSTGNEVDFVAWEKGHNESHPLWNITATMGKSIRRVSLTDDTNGVSDWVSANAQPCS